MSDPAWGRSKTERALGEFTPKKKQSPKGEKALKPVRSRLNEFRVVHVGQYLSLIHI